MDQCQHYTAANCCYSMQCPSGILTSFTQNRDLSFFAKNISNSIPLRIKTNPEVANHLSEVRNCWNNKTTLSLHSKTKNFLKQSCNTNAGKGMCWQQERSTKNILSPKCALKLSSLETACAPLDFFNHISPFSRAVPSLIHPANINHLILKPLFSFSSQVYREVLLKIYLSKRPGLDVWIFLGGKKHCHRVENGTKWSTAIWWPKGTCGFFLLSEHTIYSQPNVLW